MVKNTWKVHKHISSQEEINYSDRFHFLLFRLADIEMNINLAIWEWEKWHVYKLLRETWKQSLNIYKKKSTYILVASHPFPDNLL